MRVVRVRSEDNNFQHVEVVKRNREKRGRYGKFFVEGVSAINLAIKYGWGFDTLIFSSEKGLSEWGEGVMRTAGAKTHLDLDEALLGRLSDKEESSEILALVQMRELTMTDIPRRAGGLVVLFDRPSSPGNLGSSIRSAQAFGADAVVISGHAVDQYDPQTVRSSVGTIFTLPVVRVESHKEVLTWVDEGKTSDQPYELIGFSAKGTSDLREGGFKNSAVLAFGNETSGLSKGYKDICDRLFRIPISGEPSSLNVSCAASIAMYEFNRAR